MDGRIDVVAVFRGLWEDMPAEGKRELAAAQEVDAAIDAVAELIEAVGRYMKADIKVSDLKEFGGPEYAFRDEWRPATVEKNNASCAMRNALARVGAP